MYTYKITIYTCSILIYIILYCITRCNTIFSIKQNREYFNHDDSFSHVQNMYKNKTIFLRKRNKYVIRVLYLLEYNLNNYNILI